MSQRCVEHFLFTSCLTEAFDLDERYFGSPISLYFDPLKTNSEEMVDLKVLFNFKSAFYFLHSY